MQTDKEKLAAQQEQARKAYDQIQAQISKIETTRASTVTSENVTNQISKDRSDITIEFFSRPLDRAKIEPVLQALKFRVIEKPSKTHGVPINTITFGSTVPIEDINRLVAELAKAGVDIHVVRPINGLRKDEAVIRLSGYYNSIDVQAVGAQTPGSVSTPSTSQR